MPLAVGGATLDLLDPIPGGYLALYRDLEFADCAVNDSNCAAEARIYDCDGGLVSAIPLDPLLSRKDHLEVQDIRWADGTIYFNEACQSYSREADGRCSAMVAVEVASKKVRWRSGPLVSNNWFLVAGDYLIVAYGFTDEKSSLRVLRRRDGKIMDTHRLASTNYEMRIDGDTFTIELYEDHPAWQYRMVGFDGPSPSLVPIGSQR
jgi:hypothetical protein